MVTVTELNRAPDGRFESLEATDSFTDPSGAEYTGAINPVQITEEASTFAESDITLTQTNTAVKNGSITFLNVSNSFPDNFEDGIDAGWSGDTGSFSVTSSPALTQTQSGELAGSGTTVIVDSPTVGSITTDLVYKVRPSATDDISAVNVYNQNGTRLGRLDFNRDGTIDWVNGTNPVIRNSYNANQTYLIRLQWDFNNDKVTIFIDGVNEGTFDLDNSVSSWNYVELLADGTTIFDNAIPATNGNALIEWDSGVPADLDSYDLATFQRNLDGETVTIDVEDGNGNVLFSDISQNFDISTVDTSKEVKLRAKLSRNNTSNNPTVDYLARRFNRS